MSFQISKIVLFGPVAEPRVLDIAPGKLNVITGSSKTGKSTLISIVDYCLGSRECGVAYGPIRDTVQWYGLKLTKGEEEVFIARKAPANGENTSSAVYYEIGTKIEIPGKEEISPTTNIETAVQLLSGFAGIVDNIHEPPEGQTRPALAASVKHALYFCFQPQDEIISRKNLFYQQDEPFVPQTIKDVLPFFLGAIGDDHIVKTAKLRRLRQQLRQAKRSLTEAEAMRGEGASKATRLLAEASDAGLVKKSDDELQFNEVRQLLRNVLERRLPSIPEAGDIHGAAYEALIAEGEEKALQLRLVDQDLRGARALISLQGGYATETAERVGRLKSIGMFANSDATHVCPLCATSRTEIPTDSELVDAINELETNLAGVSDDNPHLERLVVRLEDRYSELRQELATNRQSLADLQRSQNQIAEYRDFVGRAAHIRGRISIYLEAVPADVPSSNELDEKVARLSRQIEELESDLDAEAVDERMQSSLSVVSHYVTEASQTLELEHSNHPIRFDARTLNVIADTVDQGPVSMKKMGSGANWVGYHIAVHLALHQLFVERNRPVPRFLFLDQPSQVYFPADKDTDGRLEIGRANAKVDEDRAAVLRMFELVLDSISSMKGGFQVIITEHADPDVDWYQSAVVERWRGGKALIPQRWIDAVQKSDST